MKDKILGLFFKSVFLNVFVILICGTLYGPKVILSPKVARKL